MVNLTEKLLQKWLWQRLFSEDCDGMESEVVKTQKLVSYVYTANSCFYFLFRLSKLLSHPSQNIQLPSLRSQLCNSLNTQFTLRVRRFFSQSRTDEVSGFLFPVCFGELVCHFGETTAVCGIWAVSFGTVFVWCWNWNWDWWAFGEVVWGGEVEVEVEVVWGEFWIWYWWSSLEFRWTDDSRLTW